MACVRTAPPLQVLRTGTDNVPINVPTINTVVGGPGAIAAAASVAASHPDYGNMGRASVWRTTAPRPRPGRRAVFGRLDDFEIPDLRKQAD